MLKQLTNVNVWVHDQDEALAFYTEKLGMELREDVTVPEMGDFRWLTVGVPGQPDVSIMLMAVPGPPVFDAETRKQIHALIAKGAAGGLFFATDDVRGNYEELKGRGVEFRRSRRSSHTASTPASATRRETRCEWGSRRPHSMSFVRSTRGCSGLGRPRGRSRCKRQTARL